MTTVRFWTSHTCRDGELWRRRLFLPDDFRFVFDGTDPAYLIVGEHLYADAARMRAFFALNDGKRLVLYYNGEAIFPDLNLVDYAYVFDRAATLGDRLCRIPASAYFDVDERFGSRTAVDPDEELARKTGFCNFIYANSRAHPRRDQLFRLLGGYRRIDALGPHLNNCGNRPTRTDADWRTGLVALKRPYKFSIAAENAAYSGYVTEKLTSSFRAHTVPIYWGDPTVAEEYNPDAFVDANGLSDAELLETVRRIDADDALWKKMIAAPHQTPEQRRRSEEDLERVRAFSLRLFDGRPTAEKKRAPSGYWNDIYRLSLARSFNAEKGCAKKFNAEKQRSREKMKEILTLPRRILQHVRDLCSSAPLCLINNLERRRRHLRRKLIAHGLTERESRAYLDCLYRLRGNAGHLDFDRPRTFCEKLNWLKLYYYDPLVCRCADRLLLRDYVAEKLGEEFLVPLLATYDRAEDVDFCALPDRFALKVNGGSGLNIVCPDKAQLDVADARRKLVYWMRPEANHYYDGLEWGYRGIEPKILAEEFLDDGGGDLPDYKFYCFGGAPKVCAIVRGRAGAHPTATFYDADYRRLPMTMRGWAAAEDDPPRPVLWDRMLAAAAKLAAPFPHVRVDLYAPAGGGLKVGELTFWTSNGLTPHEPRAADRALGDFLELPAFSSGASFSNASSDSSFSSN